MFDKNISSYVVQGKVLEKVDSEQNNCTVAIAMLFFARFLLFFSFDEATETFAAPTITTSIITPITKFTKSATDKDMTSSTDGPGIADEKNDQISHYGIAGIVSGGKFCEYLNIF